MTVATKRPLKYFHQFAYLALKCPDEGKVTTFAMHSAASNKAFKDAVIVAVCADCGGRYKATPWHTPGTLDGGYTLGDLDREVVDG